MNPDYADGIAAPRKSRSNKELPSARLVSLRVRRPSYNSDPQFTVMLAVFGQFLDHDITQTALNQGKFLHGSKVLIIQVFSVQVRMAVPLNAASIRVRHCIPNASQWRPARAIRTSTSSTYRA